MMKPTTTPCQTPRHDWIQAPSAQRGTTQDIPLPTSADFRHLRLLPGQLSLSDPLISSVFLIMSDQLIKRLETSHLILSVACFSAFTWRHYRLCLSWEILRFSSGELCSISSDDLLCSDVLKRHRVGVGSIEPDRGVPTTRTCLVLSYGEGAAFQANCWTSGVLRVSGNLLKIRRSGMSGGLIGEGAFRYKPNPAAGNGICRYLIYFTHSPTRGRFTL